MLCCIKLFDIKIPAEELRQNIEDLMKGKIFRCHTWCYNVPGAIIAFCVLLGLSVGFIPLMEKRALHLTPSTTGKEYLHGVILWLCLLTLYILLTLAAKRKVL